MTQTPRDWQKEVKQYEVAYGALLQEAKEGVEHERQLKAHLETIAYAPIVEPYEIECNRHKRAADLLLSTLYPDTPALKEGEAK